MSDNHKPDTFCTAAEEFVVDLRWPPAVSHWTKPDYEAYAHKHAALRRKKGLDVRSFRAPSL